MFSVGAPGPSTNMMPPVRVRLAKVWSEDRDHAIGEWSNALLTVWRDTVTVAALEVTRVASHDMHTRHKNGLVVFNHIPHVMPLPTSEVRKKASDVLGETGGHVLCTVTIIAGEGFWASAARAAVATITLFSKSPHPHRVFGTVEEGASWAARYLAGGNEAASDLADAATQLNERTG